MVILATRGTSILIKSAMDGSFSNLILLNYLRIKDNPRNVPSVKAMWWNLPLPSWIKVNIDMAVLGNPNIFSCSGVFCNYWDFVKGYFAKSLPTGFAFEVEIQAVIIVMDYGWKWN